MIDKLLQHFFPGLNDHLSDDRLASLFCNELSFVDRMVAKRHLAKCWHCRLQKEELEGPRADRIMELYRLALHSEDLDLSPEPPKQFAKRLEVHIQQLPARKRSKLRLPRISLFPWPLTNPSLTVCGVFAVATTVILLLWWQQRTPDITSNALLVRAERWDASNSSSGIVYQSIRITSPNLTMDRSIYRDRQGKRSLKKVKLAEGQERLKAALARAGVSWDEPISASDYQSWHDHQHERADKIVRSGRHLLELTTTVPESSVISQSLTVRDTDFHPIRRTVSLRNVGLVEIAELDYKILPWSAVNSDIFESPDGLPSVASLSRPKVLPFPKLPEVPTQGQLDEAELGAKLVLNQLHADGGEQIEIRRRQKDIEVEGVVDTDERKRQLQVQLRMMPHVTVSIFSANDLKNMPVAGNPETIQTASIPDQPSSLAISLQSHGRGVGEISHLAQQLYSAVLTISQESKAIDDLQTRFDPNETRTIVAAATLSELIYSHRERLMAALKSERALVAEARMTPATLVVTDRPQAVSLMDAANRNLALSRELTQTSNPAPRSAEQILEEMSASIDDLTFAANSVYGKSPGASTLSGKK